MADIFEGKKYVCIYIYVYLEHKTKKETSPANHKKT